MDPRHGNGRNKDVAAETSPEVWAKRLRRGEPAADQVVRKRVRRILSHKGLRIPSEDRLDLEQEIMTEVWLAVNRPGFDFRAGFWGFIEVVTSRRCIDWLRGRRGRVPVAEDLRDEGRNPLERVLDGERAKIASEVLEALEPECRKMIVMLLHQGVPYKEIAKTLGKSEGALRVQMHRCIHRARDIIQRVDPGACLGIEEGGPDGPS